MGYKCRDCGTEVETHAPGEPCIACKGTDFVETVSTEPAEVAHSFSIGTYTKKTAAPAIPVETEPPRPTPEVAPHGTYPRPDEVHTRRRVIRPEPTPPRSVSPDSSEHEFDSSGVCIKCGMSRIYAEELDRYECHAHRPPPPAAIRFIKRILSWYPEGLVAMLCFGMLFAIPVGLPLILL